ncbi:acetyl-CoA-benzylalcohol acetyltransferase-like [Ipomoea triloba]|uniref:acetyl-CoA-benzylalcohol acetyltransferase-like n=1 Tax=Ipomoea triloba TaxID=35885 RepID=UPI00125CE823|nr:acetyl-CoA-benzylalcohol acetyltransferase-like [Ipomoea triloba]
MAEIHTRLLTEKLIKPSTPTPENLNRLSLSLLDNLSPSTYINIIYYYNPIINQPTPHDHQTRLHLQKSLADTLTAFYPLAGRYDRDDRSVKCDDQGVGYAEVEVEGCRIVDFLDHLHGQRPCLDQYILLPHLGVAGPFPDGGCGDLAGNSSTPLVAIQVNLFKCGGAAIGVCVWHKIADSHTTIEFINAWVGRSKHFIGAKGNLQITGDDKVELQRLSFNGGSFFPVKNFPVEMPPLGHDMEVVTRRFVLNARDVSSMRTEFKEYISKVNGGGASVRTPSRVTLVTAVFWKALIGATAAIRHTRLRPSLLSPAMNLRGRTSFPAISNDSSGNFWTPFVAHFKPAANNEDNNKATLTWQDLVGPITDAMQTMLNLVQHGSGDEISLAAIKAFKEVQETMAAGGHGGEEVDAFICSSWCRFALYEADFGWGKPACVSVDNRSEMFVLMDSSGGDEGIDVWVSMDEDKMQLLEQDPHIIAFTST